MLFHVVRLDSVFLELSEIRSEMKHHCKSRTLHRSTAIEMFLQAGDLAQHATFFSFGTNDLTQMTCGFSRDDAGANVHLLPAKCLSVGWEMIAIVNARVSPDSKLFSLNTLLHRLQRPNSCPSM